MYGIYYENYTTIDTLHTELNSIYLHTHIIYTTHLMQMYIPTCIHTY